MVKNNYKFLFLFALLFSVSVSATDFGETRLRSYLGETFKASVTLRGASAGALVPSCFKARIDTIDGIALAKPRIEVDAHPADPNVATLKFSTREVIAEPAVTFTLEMICEGHMQRAYSLLLDYPEMAAMVSGAALGDASEETVMPAQTNLPKTKPVRLVPETATQLAPVERSSRKAPVRAAQPVSSKFSRDLNLAKDSLKISNEEIRMPVAAENQVPVQTPQQLELQRLKENKAAEEAFAKMMRGDTGAGSAQEDLKKALSNEQQKVQSLENELTHLKMDVQLKNRELNQARQSVPTLLIVLNVIVLTLFVIVIAVLVMKLKKARAVQKDTWSDDSFEWGRTQSGRTQSGWTNQQEEPLVNGVAVQPDPASEDVPQIKSDSAALQEQELASYLAELGVDPNLALDKMSEPAQKKSAAEKSTADQNSAASNTFNLFANRENQSIQIEELSDAMQEAEFWLSIKDPQRAIEILEPQCMSDDPATPVMWLFLLDLYRMVEDRDHYNRLRLRLKQKFNSNILEYGESPAPDTIKFLCDYDHLTNKLTAFWNTNYILPYLESLLIDDREGERAGFELSVYQDILMLIAISKELEKPEVKLHIAVE